ncbi:phosphoribosylformylglycinamidine synthase subunit PurL [Companilactobacillus sp.]|jgi:phosphoribosylformylglycinamidine synthase|uniref:phosphoribosylformylglycinamidine synthase subunit PurL n=1 Tax=Companilactobacillus sp. TaxID=2767905 RepID=UPI0025BDA2A6|nr:phosphoribosylformylglycinamidine synthase subunit PurL [Companilactobacillus sp.]MCH4008066.1 phosphoribosylformylglycinamidine synthase subunit PurL [Companilactobacillus sp.]MCH4051755.1 phosphoribosylformylglycinamidine synthase subunit PurL [Companilactobacillus sp.]MCH4076009.1 phosphoribosylformylglycinamidine synthase subunit PurL [Companilactobacillus sp.]MCH4124584.1 phosphoribosylformylglycinamidine synthase subunit PurL [Companilactobacillus sp.]MCH4132453.1 phosphoribosylformyl
MTEPTATMINEQKLYKAWGLSESEFKVITENILHRLPNYTEAGLFSVMWSEHCSYKNSKNVLRKFPNKGKRVLAGPGEDAGIIDIDDNQAVVFKAESHNHPSAVEPYQGAATGVGGIIRDIFSMGATPIAMLNSLKFGNLDDEHTKYLANEIVAGIGGYGNCIGIPTVGGEISFQDRYKNNPVVNAMCVGLINNSDIKYGKASGENNLIIYVGAKTGRDGIHGATFASDEFTDDNKTQRSAVQVGDPFMEKLLMDACIELVQEHSDWIMGIQDMGAAGLVSSTAEMASKAESGLVLELDQVPQRETGMTPYEIMLSESQERMVLCAKPEHEENILNFFKDAGLDAVVIGKVTTDNQYKIYQHGELVTDIPVAGLVDDAPEYVHKGTMPERLNDQNYKEQYQPKIDSLTNTWMDLLQQPNIASKEFFYSTYDSQIKANTMVKPGSDAAAIRVRGTQKALTMTNDGNSKLVYVDPYIGGQIAIIEASANLIATGSEPLGITDCLNYGNPEKPEIFWEFNRSVEGMASVCNELALPVISGNVSLYNEFNEEAIYPSPMIGMVGLVKNLENVMTQGFKNIGDEIYLVGKTGNDYNGSELQLMQTGDVKGELNPIDLEQVKQLQADMLEAIESGLINSCHDLSEGGLAIALAESSFENQLGFDVETKLSTSEVFSETPGRFLVSVSQENKDNFEKLFASNEEYLGSVTQENKLQLKTNDSSAELDLSEAFKNWKEAIPCLMK